MKGSSQDLMYYYKSAKGDIISISATSSAGPDTVSALLVLTFFGSDGSAVIRDSQMFRLCPSLNDDYCRWSVRNIPSGWKRISEEEYKYGLKAWSDNRKSTPELQTTYNGKFMAFS